MKQQSINRFFAAKSTGDAANKTEASKKKRKTSPASGTAAERKRSPSPRTEDELGDEISTPPKRLRKASPKRSPKDATSDSELHDTPYRTNPGISSAGHTPGDVTDRNANFAGLSMKSNRSSQFEEMKREGKLQFSIDEPQNSSSDAAGSPISTSASAKKGKKISKGTAKDSKVEGVGKGSIAAAAHHKDFDPDSVELWKSGAPVPYTFLADAFDSIGDTSKRLEITKILTECFRSIVSKTPDDLLPAVYLCVNSVGPAHEGLEMGIGDSILTKAVAQALGKTPAVIKKEYEKSGDLGQVAVSSRSSQQTLFKAKELTVRDVFSSFQTIAKSHGDKSQDKKRDIIVKLLAGSKTSEAGYIIRSLQGKLRIGLAEQTVLSSLAQAIFLEKDEHAADDALAGALETSTQAVKQAFSVCPSYDKLVPALLKHGTANLCTRIGFVPGVPVRPMLAKPTLGITEVLDKFSDVEFTCEYKYDGERAQIHILEGGTVQIYSRNAENTTGRYPDIVERIAEQLKDSVTSAVLDAEAVAYDEKEGLLPFQVLSTRARKDVALEDIKVQICLFCFDCLHLNGTTLLGKDLSARRSALYSALTPKKGKLEFATTETSKDIEELQAFLDRSVDNRTEGLIVKTLDGTYEPSKRSVNWLKLKKDYMDGMGDTFDVVPIGAWHGKGKRTGFFGSYLLATYDPDSEEFQTISKIGTGFKDEDLVSLTEEMKKHEIDKPKSYYRYGTTLEPEVWFGPEVVWEVKAADLSISPVHQAAKGLIDPTKGISIRFPRLVRVREDKKPEDATSAQQIADMYNDQPSVKSSKAAVDEGSA